MNEDILKEVIKIIDEEIERIKYSLHLGTILEEQAGKNAFEDIETIENGTVDILEELKQKLQERK